MIGGQNVVLLPTQRDDRRLHSMFDHIVVELIKNTKPKTPQIDVFAFDRHISTREMVMAIPDIDMM